MKRKRYLLTIGVLVLSLGLFGCAEDTEEEPANEDEPIAVEDNGEENEDLDPNISEDVINEFGEILAGNGEIEELVNFVDENISKVTSIEGDQMVSELIDKLEGSEEEYTDKLMELDKGNLVNLSNEEYFPKDKVEDIEDEELRKLVEELVANKYKLEASEGMYYPIVDYEGLKEYNDYVSDEIKDYIDLKAIDSNTIIVSDGALVIPHDKLAEIIIETEEYIERYAGGTYSDEAERMYESKLDIYLSGLPNTPIYDYESKEVKDPILDSYVKTGSSGDSVTSFVVAKYVNTIGENENIIDEDVLKEAGMLLEEAVDLLRSAK